MFLNKVYIVFSPTSQFFKILKQLMLTYLSCSPVAQAIPRFLSETLQELRRNTFPIKTPQRHCQSFCACDKLNRRVPKFKIKAMLSCFFSAVKNSEDFMLLCQKPINQDKQPSKQSKNTHTKMCIPLQNNAHEELDF